MQNALLFYQSVCLSNAGTALSVKTNRQIVTLFDILVGASF